jgi:hypothetical protein
MDKAQTRVRPGFVFGALLVLAGLCWLVTSGVPTEKEKARAKILLTRSEERLMASLLQEHSINVGGLTNIDTEFVLNSFITTNKH